MVNQRKLIKLVSIFLPALLVLISLFLAFRNYASGTFLIGWDSLHPEFNFIEAFKRVFFGVWREEQGLGALAYHSHMADWPRILLLTIESIFLPESFLRYSYIFLCLVLGPLGVYFFLNYVLRRDTEGIGSYLAAFFGGTYYLLNLTTLQHFIVPFEMFTTQYAFLPWLFYAALRYLREGKKKYLVYFSLLTIVSSPQAYAATLFYAYLGALCLFCLSYRFRRGVLIVLVSIFLNLYWIAPNVYSAVKGGEAVTLARINSMFSPEVFLRGQNYSGLGDIFLQKNFLFDWRVFDFEGQRFVNLMGSWENHLSLPYVRLMLYALAAASVLGLIISLVRKDKLSLSMLLISAYAFIFLSSPAFFPPIGILKEALRMPFTKFSIIFLFGLIYFVSVFLHKLFRKITIGIIGSFVFLTMVLCISVPMFNGRLVSEVVRKELPGEYFELFDWFEGKDGRIARLPIHTFWGWDHQSWMYEGSGYLTYGIKNPLLVRDFDRWSPHNETFFNELSFSIYQKDSDLFKSVVRKYQVKYILLDESLINAGGNSDILFVPEIKSIISELGYEQVFLQGSLAVFDTGLENENGFVRTSTSFSPLNVDLTYAPIDPFYGTAGDYFFDETAVGYPFTNFDRRGDVKTEVVGSDIKFTNSRMGADVSFPTNGLVIESFGEGRGLVDAQNCDIKKIGSVTKLVSGGGVSYVARDGGVACDYFAYPQLFHNQAYVLRLRGENREGRSLKIYLQNWGTNRFDIEELLPTGKFDEYYFIYPTNQDSMGYTLNLETRSFGKVSSENILYGIEFYPVDSELLSGIYKEGRGETVLNYLTIKDVEKYGITLYKVRKEGGGLLVLSQGYEDGWVALANMDGKWQKLSHLKVNSWENGWIVPTDEGSANTDQQFVFIVFWPQLLEWVGLLIGISALLVILRSPALDR